MKSKKGFTLVELLVVLVILGIITGISIPIIRNITQRNEDKKYTTYRDSIRYSAKLYVNSYEEDLFGYKKSGCAIITYQQMQEKGLLKDIPMDGISCNSEKTFAKVVKVDDQYGYSISIGCGPKDENGNVLVETQIPAGGLNLYSCGIESHNLMLFSGTPIPDSAINHQKRSVTINVTSNTGFSQGAEVYYASIKMIDVPTSEDITPTSVIGEWKPLTLNYPELAKQVDLTEKGEPVSTTFKEMVETPTGETGDFYFVLKINHLQDMAGQNWTDNENVHYAYVGPYRIDNTKPVFNEGSGVTSSESGYNSTIPKLNLNVTDIYSTIDATNELRMCISYDDDTCSKKVKDIKKKQKGYITYSGNKVLDKIQEDYDGSTHTIYVTVGDAAGNYETKSYSYKLATTYTLTYDSNGGTACNPSFKSSTFDSATPKWGNLCTPSRDHYSFIGWNTKKDGTGDTITEDSEAVENITVYAQWKIDTYTITYYGNGNTGGETSPTTCDYNANCPLRSNGFTKEGYIFDGWYTAASGGTKYESSTKLTKNINVYAHWNPDGPGGTLVEFQHGYWAFKYDSGFSCFDSADGSCDTANGARTAGVLGDSNPSNKYKVWVISIDPKSQHYPHVNGGVFDGYCGKVVGWASIESFRGKTTAGLAAFGQCVYLGKNCVPSLFTPVEGEDYKIVGGVKYIKVEWRDTTNEFNCAFNKPDGCKIRNYGNLNICDI